MPDPIKLITKRLTTMTYQIVDGTRQFIWGSVISRNSDGTLNVDDGKGGCVLVVPPVNARTGDRVLVDLGAVVGGVGMPSAAAYGASVPQVNHPSAARFVDNRGVIYNDVGVCIGLNGEPVAESDGSYGYYHMGVGGFPNGDYLLWAGAGPQWHDVQIGNNDPDAGAIWGYQGESYYANNTVLCAGIHPAEDVLCGAEHLNISGSCEFRYVINLRDRATFELLASNAADYIHDWMWSHPNVFPNASPHGDEDYDVHISADPVDGSFWVNLTGGYPYDPPNQAPMFNISSTDGSLIRTVELQVAVDPDSQFSDFFRRVHRVLIQPTADVTL